MSKQYNKAEKRQRRKKYLKRRGAASRAKTKPAGAAEPATAPAA
jgi:hypothetical protein